MGVEWAFLPLSLPLGVWCRLESCFIFVLYLQLKVDPLDTGSQQAQAPWVQGGVFFTDNASKPRILSFLSAG